MSIAQFASSEAAIAQCAVPTGADKKTPPKRTATALKDVTAAPEAR